MKKILHPSGLVIPQAQPTQLELDLKREREADRNLHLGGRSFYFFDFDDNVACLLTPLILFHKKTREERAISSHEFAKEQSNIGRSGIWKDFEVDANDQTGTFRCFRDHTDQELLRQGLKTQVFLHDIAEALALADLQWKGPSWSCFYHATFNQRPISVITARGHSPETIQAGIELFVHSGHLPQQPSYLSIFPVSHIPTRQLLGDSQLIEKTAELKQRAIRASVETAIQKYGYSPHHRFGMSDDDPRNIELIIEEMRELKRDYPELSFYMIETHGGQFHKHEIVGTGVDSKSISADQLQVELFSDDSEDPSSKK